ncbi:flagellar motor protein MotD [Dyella nitratireducens]|uniref:Flagellar motor protein MotD n=1 Tax=Dyella nitratireducens TaxID=1849580 RepID=A0ABQ1FR45_9GAMM|nr:flagellar motor protein MotD [Dyella nitratireducens]GGA27413.1 flagellar motor protein MotD [Dyella nitratireducens]GLQ43418.1 flagellar motor protein MotD [Dyella nitratireducens]
MRRRHKHEEHANHEAWVIPYADLLTLLLALFVVLYAMSSVNTTKYRALAQAISAAFNGSRAVIQPVTPNSPQSSTPVPTNKPAPIPRTPLAQILLPVLTQHIAAPNASPGTPTDQNKTKLSEEQQNLERIRNEVEHALQPLIDKNLVVVRRTPNWLEIEIRTDILFPSGVATLSPSATQILTSLGDILAPFGNPLRVEGYTDDMPINTAVYPSNWELSAARAASVARLFAEHGVDPERLGIVGWGQYRPAADNTSIDGRNKNRRVLVVVLSDKAAPRRFYTNSDQINQTADTNGDATDDSNAPASPAPSVAAQPAAPVQTAPLVVTPPATLPAPQVITPIASLITTPEAPHAITPDNKG